MPNSHHVRVKDQILDQNAHYQYSVPKKAVKDVVIFYCCAVASMYWLNSAVSTVDISFEPWLVVRRHLLASTVTKEMESP